MIGRRADGYHELRSLFQSIDLADGVRCRLEARPGVRLEVVEGVAPGGRENLMVRAAEAFAARWAPELGVAMELAKRVPMGGGLGGGSGNAATVLRALRDLTGRPERLEELWPVARELGADVPFFLVEGTALGFGRGDEVVPVPDLPETELWLAVPSLHISTADAFARLPEPSAEPLAPAVLALVHGAPAAPLESLAAGNDFEAHVRRWYPVIDDVYNSLLEAGAKVVRLSGTGASLFAIFDEGSQPGDANLPAGTSLLPTRTLSRTSIAARRTQPWR